MARAGLVWTIPPAVIAANITRLGPMLDAKISQRASTFATQAQARMQIAAPWTNRSGAARAGLSVTAMVGGAVIILEYAHGVFYGIYLELKNQGRYAIVIPSVQADGPLLMSSFEGLL